MASLVANYSSDDDSSEDDADNTDTPTVQLGQVVPTVTQTTGVIDRNVTDTPVTDTVTLATNTVTKDTDKIDYDLEKQAKNYFESKDSGDSDSDDCNTTKQPVEELPSPVLERLPRPKLGKKKKNSIGPGLVKKHAVGSVFSNQYEKAELVKQSILEKHVKMTVKEDRIGKEAKVCRKFRQGRCRFEKNCKYSHDLDANLSLRYTQQEDPEGQESTPAGSRQNHFPRLPPPPKPQGFMGTMHTLNTVPRPTYTPHQRRNFQQQERQMQNSHEEDDDNFMAGDKRKKRIGMSQSLVPPKKALTALTKQRNDERPWTLNQ